MLSIPPTIASGRDARPRVRHEAGPGGSSARTRGFGATTGSGAKVAGVVLERTRPSAEVAREAR
jgi:hypothetical protein